MSKEYPEFTVPKGVQIESVKACTGVGHLSYPLNQAIAQGHIKPVNISRGRYRVTPSGSTYEIKVILSVRL